MEDCERLRRPTTAGTAESNALMENAINERTLCMNCNTI
jgi:hypothetical protein